MMFHMKQFSLSLFIILGAFPFLQFPLHAETPVLMWQPGIIKDAGDQVIRRLDEHGEIQDGSELLMGHMNHHGNIYDSGGMLLGVLHRDHKITNREGMILGYYETNGLIHGYHNILGQYKDDGLLVDVHGQTLAHFPKNDGDIAALYLLGVLP